MLLGPVALGTTPVCPRAAKPIKWLLHESKIGQERQRHTIRQEKGVQRQIMREREANQVDVSLPVSYRHFGMMRTGNHRTEKFHCESSW